METKQDTSASTPRKMTFAENAIMTLKVLAIAALILGGLWGMNQINAR
jgi:hypothetical protein